MALAQLVLFPHLAVVQGVSVLPFSKDPWRSREGSDGSCTSEPFSELLISGGQC